MYRTDIQDCPSHVWIGQKTSRTAWFFICIKCYQKISFAERDWPVFLPPPERLFGQCPATPADPSADEIAEAIRVRNEKQGFGV